MYNEGRHKTSVIACDKAQTHMISSCISLVWLFLFDFDARVKNRRFKCLKYVKNMFICTDDGAQNLHQLISSLETILKIQPTSTNPFSNKNRMLISI